MADPTPNTDGTKAKPKDGVAFIAEARKRFQRCIEANTENRAFQLDDIKFAAGSPDNGWQWPEAVLNARMKDPNGARPTLTVNKLPQHIKLVTNEQRKNRPQGKVLPVDDKGDIEVAEILNGVVRHIEVSSHADVAYDTACENQVTIGEGYWRILTDYCDEMSFDQDIKIAPIKNSFSVYLDPDGLKRDSVGRECEYGFITDRLPTDVYKREFPKAKSKADWDDLQKGDDSFDWFDDEGVTIAEYFHVEYEKITILLLSDGRVFEKPKEEEMDAALAAMAEVGLSVIDERDTQKRIVKWCKINGIEVLEEREWAGKFIPIVRLVGNEWDVEGQIVVSGIVRNAKDPQRMVNYWTSQEAEMLALAPKAPFIGAVGQFEGQEDRWRDANVQNFAYLEYNPIDVNGSALPPPQRQQPPLPPAGLISAKLGSADDLQATVGQYNPSLGAEAKEKSGRAIQARQQQADVGTYHYIDNLSRSIGFSTEIILDLIPKIIDTKRVARIIGEDGEPDNAVISVGAGQAVTEEQDEMGDIQKIYDPSVGRYDVVVSVGPSFQTKRLEMAEFLTASAQAAKDPITAQILTYLSLKSSDWAGAEEATKMIKKLLPPEIKEDEEGKSDPEAQMEQVRQAAQMIGQKEAEIQAREQQIMEFTEQAKEQEQKAKDATVKAQEKVNEINSSAAELGAKQQLLDAAQRELQMEKELALKELENKRLSDELNLAKKEAAIEQAMAARDEAIRSEVSEIKHHLQMFEVKDQGAEHERRT